MILLSARIIASCYTCSFLLLVYNAVQCKQIHTIRVYVVVSDGSGGLGCAREASWFNGFQPLRALSKWFFIFVVALEWYARLHQKFWLQSLFAVWRPFIPSYQLHRALFVIWTWFQLILISIITEFGTHWIWCVCTQHSGWVTHYFIVYVSKTALSIWSYWNSTASANLIIHFRMEY